MQYPENSDIELYSNVVLPKVWAVHLNKHYGESICITKENVFRKFCKPWWRDRESYGRLGMHWEGFSQAVNRSVFPVLCAEDNVYQKA